MSTLDLRPALLKLKVYPNQRHTIIFHFPEDSLSGSWEARVDDEPVESTVISGDDLSVNFVTPAETGSYSFKLWALDDEPDSIKILGSVAVSESATTVVSSTEVTISLNTAAVTIEVVGAAASGFDPVIYLGSAAELVSDPGEARPDYDGPVYWLMAQGVTPLNAAIGDIIFNASS